MMDILSNFINNGLNELVDTLVMKDGDTYYLYNKYVIFFKKTHYKVVSLTKFEPLEFTTLKNAIAWCVLDYNKKYYDAKKIQRLDLMLHCANSDIIIQKNMLKSSSNSFIILNKLQEAFYKRRQILEEIKELSTIAKSLQEKKFSKKGYEKPKQ